MSKSSKRTLVVLFFLSFLPILSFAQGFQVNLEGQKQISMAGTGTGSSLNEATVFYNPGGISLLKDNYISGGINPLFLRAGFTGAPPSQYQTQSNTFSPPFQGYLVLGPKNLGIKFGLGVYNPFGGAYNWGNSWEGRYSLEKLELRSTFIQPTISLRLSPRLGIGGGFIFALGYVDLTKAIPLADSSGTDGQSELTGHASGHGYNLGIFYQATDEFSVGLSYRSQVQMKTDQGKAVFKVPASLASNFPSPDAFTNTLPLPASFNLGFGYKPSREFSLAFDVNYIQWSVYKTLEFDFASTTPLLTNSISQRNYKDTYDLRLGAQYIVSPSFQVRAGIAYGATSIRDGYVTPETTDANRIGLSAGCGYAFTKHFNLDISYLYELIGPRFQTNLESGLSGTYKTSAYIPGLSLTYRF
jgi:long-chain fatty acid transport protein